MKITGKQITPLTKLLRYNLRVLARVLSAVPNSNGRTLVISTLTHIHLARKPVVQMMKVRSNSSKNSCKVLKMAQSRIKMKSIQFKNFMLLFQRKMKKKIKLLGVKMWIK